MIIFTIPGPPAGKGRPRFFKRGNFAGAYTPAKTTQYENLVKTSFRMVHCGNPAEAALKVEIVAYFAIPVSATKRFKAEAETEETPVLKKPDADNIIKIILDALNQIAYRDDAQVYEVSCTKLYSQKPRTVVKISEYYQAIF